MEGLVADREKPRLGGRGFVKFCNLGVTLGQESIPQGLKRVMKKSPRGEKTYLSG